MKKILVILLFILLTAGFVSSLSWSIPDEIAQGEVLKIILWNEEPLFERISAEILVNGKAWSSSESFSPGVDTGAGWIGIVLLGVPSDTPAGSAELRLDFSRLSGGEGEENFRHLIRIREFDFLREEIPLNSAMSDLRQGDDIEKAKQWRRLYTILTTFNPESIYLEGRFILPVAPDSRRTSFYGDRRIFLYTDGNTAQSIHHGIDFSGIPGTAVRAAGKGRVAFSGTRILTGETIVIEHLPGVFSSYYHMKDRFFSEGDRVEEEDLIGTIGATGLVTGAHLHWEIRVNGVSVSPDSLIETPLIDKISILSMME